MKKIKFTLCGGLTLLFALMCMGELKAQNGKYQTLTPAVVELTKNKALWFNAPNAAGLALDQMHGYNRFSLGYDINDGGFKFQQAGEKEQNRYFNTEGVLDLGAAVLYGDFAYEDKVFEGTRFNTSLLDPFRGIPAYYVADRNVSDWLVRANSLNFKAASPFFGDRFAIGVSGNYKSMSGAKQADPRGTTYYIQYAVAPGVAIKLNQNNYIGLHMIYAGLSERISIGNSDSQTSQDGYILAGLGNFSIGSIGSFGSISTYANTSNLLGGGLQYGFYGNVHFLISGEYNYKVEDVIITPITPKYLGSTRDQRYVAKAQLATTGDNLHRATLGYDYDYLDGIQYVQEQDEGQAWYIATGTVRLNNKHTQIYVNYDFFKCEGISYTWKAGAFVRYSDMKQVFYIPHSHLNAENLTFGADFKFNFPSNACGCSWLLVGLNVGYNANLSGEYVYGGVAPESIVVNEFVRPDFMFMTSNFYYAGAEATLSQFVGQKGNSWFLKASAQYFKPSEGDNHRLFSGFSLGLNF